MFVARLIPIAVFAAVLAQAIPAFEGPPYQTDDPELTDYRHFEIYFFDGGTATRSGTGHLAGIDFNYGVAPEFQLDVVAPAGFGNAGVVYRWVSATPCRVKTRSLSAMFSSH